MNQIIAITLIVVVAAPIALGYGLAFDEVERTGWKSTEQANLSGLILNSETEYYNVSTVPGNNSELIGTDSDLSGSEIFAPGFNDISGTASSLPIYATEEENLTIDVSVVRVVDPASYINYDADAAVVSWYVPYLVSGDVIIMDSLGATYRLEFGDYVIMYRTDSSTLVDPNTGITLNSTRGIYLYGNPSQAPLDVYYYGYTTAPIAYDWAIASDVAVKFTSGGQTIYTKGINSTLWLNSALIVDGTTYTDITDLALAPSMPSSAATLTLTKTVPVPGSFANPSAGWNVTGSYDRVFWASGQTNQSVQMLVKIPVLESSNVVTFAPMQGYNSGPVLTISRDTLGMVTASVGGESYDLGQYEFLQVIISTKGYEVSGIVGWPSMYSPANKINTWSYEFDTPLDDFLRIELANNTTVSYRVDSSVIVAGTYPVAEDFALDVTQYWPNASWAIRFPNIGVYGSGLTYGGIDFPIVNGQITYSTANGTNTASPLGLLFQATYDSGVWTYSINGNEQATSEDALPLVFNGVWSLSVEGYKVEKVTTTTLEWVPGEFGLDKTDFVLIGLAACGMVFVGLGLYGQRTGHKMLTLMIICGIVALVLFFML